MQAIKRGSDFPINILNVRSTVNGTLLPTANVSYVLYDRANGAIDGADATLIDSDSAWFQIVIPKAITALLELMERFRLDLIFEHNGIEIAKSYELTAVDFLPP